MRASFAVSDPRHLLNYQRTKLQTETETETDTD
jgi:hypothetical protein